MFPPLDHKARSGAAHCINLRHAADGSLRTIQSPIEIGVGRSVDYIHVTTSSHNLLRKDPDSDSKIVFFGYFNPATNQAVLNSKEQTLDAGGAIRQVLYVGNTIIVLTDRGRRHFLFKNNSYLSLGEAPPTPKVRYRFKKFDPATDLMAENAPSAAKNQIVNGVYFHQSPDFADVNDEMQWAIEGAFLENNPLETVVNAISDDFAALYAKSVNDVYSTGLLPDFPVVVRVALRLYDGSHIMHTPPVMLNNSNGLSSAVYALRHLSKLADRPIFKGKMVFGSAKQFAVDNFPIKEFNGEKLVFGREGGFDNYTATITDSSRNPAKAKVMLVMGESPSSGLYEHDVDLYHPLETSCPNKEKLNSLDPNAYEAIGKTAETCRFAMRCRSLGIMIRNVTDYSQWADIVDGIDIFISRPVEPFLPGEKAQYPPAGRRTWDNDTYKKPFQESIYEMALYTEVEACRNNIYPIPSNSPQQIRDTVINNGNFYLLHRIDFINDHDNAMKFANHFVSMADDIAERMSTIEQRETLDDDFMSHDSIAASTAHVYNNALYMGDIRRSLFNGFAPIDFAIEGDSDRIFSGNGGVKTTVYSDEQACPCVVDNESSSEGFRPSYFSPLFFYPDSDASTADFRAMVTDDETKWMCHKAVLPLQPSPAINGAVYLSPDMTPFISNSGEPTVTLNDFAESSPTIHNPNQLISSSISNPFRLDADSSNRVGTGVIKAISAATIELSQGQFGQGTFALYIFCSDGIFAASISSDGKMSTIRPVSFDSLLSPSLVAPMESSIVFATSQGVKVIQGGQTAMISDPVFFEPADYSSGGQYENPRLRDILSRHRVKGAYFMKLSDFLNRPETSIRYDYANREVWIANPADGFARIYSMNSKSWSTRAISFDRLITSFPNLYAVRGGYLCVLSAPEDPDNTDPMPFTYISNPTESDTFRKFEGARIDFLSPAPDFNVAVHVGNNPWRMPCASSTHARCTSPASALRIPRVATSARFFQYALWGICRDTSFHKIEASFSDLPYNHLR